MSTYLQRRYERVSFSCKLELTQLAGGPPQPAHSLDLSLGGVGAITGASFSVGQLVTVTFYRHDANQKEIVDRVLGRIAHFAADVDANRLGIQFLEPLNESEHPALYGKLLSL